MAIYILFDEVHVCVLKYKINEIISVLPYQVFLFDFSLIA